MHCWHGRRHPGSHLLDARQEAPHRPSRSNRPQRIVEYYNRYYSIKYPFKKLDIVAVPDFAAGAMENTGAIFYRETLLLADADASVGVRKNDRRACSRTRLRTSGSAIS